MRQYDAQTKIEAVPLCKAIGVYKLSLELDIPEGTLRTWMDKVRKGEPP